MSRNKSVVVALCCALVLAAPAGATEFFWDDFNDNDMSDWSNLSLTVQPFWQVVHGMYGYGSRGEDPAETPEARSSKPLSNTSLSDTVHISFEVMHTGGHLGKGRTGEKRTRVWFVDGTGKGYGISAFLNKDTQDGQIRVVETTDFGATVNDRGGYNIAWTPYWAEHRVEAVYDRTAGRIDLYWESNPIGQVVLDPGENNTHKDFTQVISGPRETSTSSTRSAGYLSTDDIWIGDPANPHAPLEPILMPGDTNSDWKVDIVDLTALASNWQIIEPNYPKDWTQGNFDFGGWDDPTTWTVDIIDLTALAANWTFGPGSAAPVPEPATLALLVIGGVALLRRRRA